MNYISFEDLETTKINLNFFNEEGTSEENIYQIQSLKNKKKSCIMFVGFMKKTNDILIKEFDLQTKFKCYMISKIYSKDTLKEIEKNCKFPMIKIIISSNNQTNLIPISFLSFNFHTYDHFIKKLSIIEFLSNKELKKKLRGFYSISLHFRENNQNKFINLETFKKYPGNESILILLTEWLLNDTVLDIINKLT